MREDFPNVSPYAYCAHDPINYTDPTGLYLNVSEATWQGRRSLPSATSSEVLDMRMFREFQNASLNLMGERHYQWLIHEFFKREVRDMISGMNYYDDKSLLGGIGSGILGEAGAIYFENRNEAYEYMWVNSHDEHGNPLREVSAFDLVNGATIVLPYDKNTLNTSHNDALNIRSYKNSASGGYDHFVGFDGTYYRIETQIHTHPGVSLDVANRLGISDNDVNYIKDIGRPIKVIYGGEVYRVNGSRFSVGGYIGTYNYENLGTW